MYFLKFALSTLILLFYFKSTSSELQDSVKKIVAATRELQREVENAYRDYNASCNSSNGRVSDYEKIVSDFLKENFTLHETPRLIPVVNEPLKSTNVTESFLAKLKRKLFEFVNRSKTVSQPETRIKRCLAINDSDLNGVEITIERKDFNVTNEALDDFENFLKSLINCLKQRKISDDDSQPTTSDQPYQTVEPIDQSSPAPIHNHPFNNSRIENLLRYLTQAKHPVRDTGRPAYKSPDLQKIQAIVDQVKGFDFFNLDEATENNLASGSDVDAVKPELTLLEGEVLKRFDRNILTDWSEKIKNFVGKSRKTKMKDSGMERKQKRKSSALFSNVDVVQDNYEPPAEEQNSDEDIEVEKSEAVQQPSESEKLLTDLSSFESRLSADQQVEISNFLDHISDKPKAFKFDTSPYLLTQLEKLNHPTVENQENSQDEEILEGAKKFFDFDSAPAKRSLYNNDVEDFQKIAKLKSKLIAEYREHHPVIDYSGILRKIENDKRQMAEKGDDFIDHFYQLNDGTSGIHDVFKPYHPERRVLSPYELDLKFQLDSQFKELDAFDTIQNKQKGSQTSGDSPLYKPEIQLEAEDLSP